MSGIDEQLTGHVLVKRYRMQEVIGRGGFAAVYRADDERLGRPVAVKVITIAERDPEATARHRERFEREARAAASLPQHPNVVTVHDFGIDPTLGIDFLVMEFLHGEDLASRLGRSGRLGQEEALRILREAAAGIAVGHRAGIVHRDVKPGNIFLARSRPGEMERVCILDFGIAQAVEDEDTLPAPGEGTPLSPAYASPEQSRGSADVTSASDVFSLGVVGYQLLTGEKPFPAQRRLAPEEWVPTRGMREIDPGIAPAVEGVIMRALAFDPGQRFSDAEDFCSALASAGTGDATILMPPPLGATEDPGVPPIGPDRTLFQPPVDTAPPRRPQLTYGDPQPPRRRAGWIFLLLLLAAGAAGWWYFGSDRNGNPTFPDGAATEDLETIREGLEEEESPDTERRPAVRVAVPPREIEPPGGTPSGTAPLDSVLQGLPVTPPTFPPGDTTATPLPEPLPEQQSEGEAPEPGPADSAPPRVLGVPVDSVRNEEAVPPSAASRGASGSAGA